ncbi:hypothetical protein SNEBB_005914 [Seison nebaliae]|nr:hypothetical protein SNEBB_005914 [Seison nebaliae]
MIECLFFFSHSLPNANWIEDKANLYCKEEPVLHPLKMNSLIRGLFTNYSRHVPPVREDTTSNGCPIRMQIDLKIHQLFEVNEVQQTLTFLAELYLRWSDPRLAWDPNALPYKVSWTFIPKNSIWFPDMYLYENTASDYATDILRDSFVLLKHDGSMRFNKPLIAKTQCQIDIQYFPYDYQTCNISLGSYVMDDRYLRLDRVLRLSKPNETLHENDQWKIKSFNTALYYNRDPQNNNFSAITFQMVLVRKPLFYMIYLVSPVIFLAYLAPAVFLIPVDSGERISYSVTLLLTLMIFLQIVMTIMPKTSTKMPKISVFYLSIIVCAAITLMANIVVVKIYQFGKDEFQRTKPGKWILTLAYVLGHVSCKKKMIPRHWRNAYKTTLRMKRMKKNQVEGEDSVSKDKTEWKKLSHDNTSEHDWILLSILVDRMFLVLGLLLATAVIIPFIVDLITH